MTIKVGTASWTDKTLIACGRFYPKEAKTAEGRLRYYASQFPLVEVDSSYYAMPSPTNAQLWAERTPDGFTMNVKAFRLFTGHHTQPNVMHKDIQEALAKDGNGPGGTKTLYYRTTPVEIRTELWRRFIEALAPLKDAGKLGLVHFQFPPWLLRNREGHDHVWHCVEQMAGHTVSIELRNATWFEEPHRRQTLRFIQELRAVHTIVDGPQGFSNSVPAIWEATHPDYALVRLHGRNTATWNVKGATAASDRFNYDYPDDELRDLAGEIGRLVKMAKNPHVIFINNMEDQGQRNARTLARLLALPSDVIGT
ncbi:uncharacterized protein YecE (DUF72 family) [Variovorax sp. GrIS 2.14]|uniref:DUF72 domain-containing protein n=1 Tax=Variovorax sp. GrIS 2.14 TaxID=3071709 RepID=UPI0038F64737